MKSNASRKITLDETLRQALVALEVNDSYSEVVLGLRDQSRLCFCHRVGERWVRALEEGQREKTLAHELLEQIQSFRLNAKHLEIFFVDNSCWEMSFRSKKK